MHVQGSAKFSPLPPLVLIIFCACATPESLPETVATSPLDLLESDAAHEFLVFGSGPLYLSYRNLAEPSYQVIIEVEINDFSHGEKRSIASFLADDRRRMKHEAYYLKSAPFSLNSLFPPAKGIPKRSQFKGDLYRDNLQTGSRVRIVKEAMIISKRVILARKLKHQAEDSVVSEQSGETVAIFGTRREMFAAKIFDESPGLPPIQEIRILKVGVVPRSADLISGRIFVVSRKKNGRVEAHSEREPENTIEFSVLNCVAATCDSSSGRAL
jgi:hypothetical protein